MVRGGGGLGFKAGHSGVWRNRIACDLLEQGWRCHLGFWCDQLGGMSVAQRKTAGGTRLGEREEVKRSVGLG